MFLLQVSLLTLVCFVNIQFIHSSCQKSFVVICDSLSDVEHNSKRKTWSELLIQNKYYDEYRPRYILKSQLDRDLSNLKWLIINEQLSEIKSGAFTYCKNLQQLILYGNNIPIIRTSTFVFFRNLLKLGLENNNIEQVEKKAFLRSTIEEVDLSYNKLQVLPTDLFITCTVSTLRVTNNRLYNIDSNSLPRNLKNLHLDGNSLYSLPQEIKNLGKLQELTLSNNKLNNVPELGQLASLTKLDLSFNGIESVSSEFDSLRNLKYLHLSGNHIQKFTFTRQFIQIIKEQFFLLLAHNRLRNLDLHQIRNAEVTLTLSGNPWNCKCMDKMLELIRNHNVTTTACDQLIFTSGQNPYCTADDGPTCSEDRIPNYVLQDFEKASKNNKCDVFHDVEKIVG